MQEQCGGVDVGEVHWVPTAGTAHRAGTCAYECRHYPQHTACRVDAGAHQSCTPLIPLFLISSFSLPLSPASPPLPCRAQGLLPRSFPGILLELLAALVAPLVQWGFAAMFDRVSRKFAPRRFDKLWGGMEAASAKAGGGGGSTEKASALGSASGSGAAL
eukprot:XP_001691589.1 predicted protein [Chlamydomonas reinhardtii]